MIGRCEVCGRETSACYGYVDMRNGVRGSWNAGNSLEICNICLLRHMRAVYPGCAIEQHIVYHYQYEHDTAALEQYTPLAITHRLAERFIIDKHLPYNIYLGA